MFHSDWPQECLDLPLGSQDLGRTHGYLEDLVDFLDNSRAIRKSWGILSFLRMVTSEVIHLHM